MLLYYILYYNTARILTLFVFWTYANKYASEDKKRNRNEFGIMYKRKKEIEIKYCADQVYRDNVNGNRKQVLWRG